jgi:hypothetical protein
MYFIFTMYVTIGTLYFLPAIRRFGLLILIWLIER